MDHIVVDVEIQRTIEDTPGGWDATDKLGVSVACVWEYRDERMRVYGPDDVSELRRRLLQADRISGFNIFNFDFPVIWGKSKPEWIDAGLPKPDVPPDKLSTCAELKQRLMPKTDDMLRRIWQSKGLNPDRFSPTTHGGYKLDAITEATLGVGKIGHGASAPVWYKEGLIHRVINYCADDVALERDLTDFVDWYRYILRSDSNGRLEKVHMLPWKPGCV